MNSAFYRIGLVFILVCLQACGLCDDDSTKLTATISMTNHLSEPLTIIAWGGRDQSDQDRAYTVPVSDDEFIIQHEWICEYPKNRLHVDIQSESGLMQTLQYEMSTYDGDVCYKREIRAHIVCEQEACRDTAGPAPVVTPGR